MNGEEARNVMLLLVAVVVLGMILYGIWRRP